MNQVKVGLGVIVLKQNNALVGKRKGSHGEGHYAFPGGHLDYNESWESCAIRELLEETGLKVKYRPFDKIQEYAFVTNNIMKEDNKHYVTIFVLADYIDGKPELKEPHKCECWAWKTFEEILAIANDTDHWLPKTHLTNLFEKLTYFQKPTKARFCEN